MKLSREFLNWSELRTLIESIVTNLIEDIGQEFGKVIGGGFNERSDGTEGGKHRACGP